MPKHTDKEYYFENEPITVFNIVKYLTYLETYDIIPKFEFYNDDINLYFEIVYTDYIGKWKKQGIALITYNIYKKKWKSIIDHTSYKELYEKYYYLVENDMIKVNFTHPYVEYELESEYIEDILEPSLNSFDNTYLNNYNVPLNINPYNVIQDVIQYDFNNSLYGIQRLYYLTCYDKLQNIGPFYINFYEHEKYLNFEECKKVYIDNNLLLPNEIWKYIYIYI
jgi:hypothetical protein